MTADQLTNLDIILQLIQTGGVVVVLVLISYAFMTGKLISRPMHDEILRVYEKQASKMADAFGRRMNGLNKNVDELVEISREEKLETERTRDKMLVITDKIIDSLDRLNNYLERKNV